MSTPTKCSRLLERSRSMKLKFTFLTLTAGLVFAAACTDAAKPPALVDAGTPPPAVKDQHADDGHDAPRITLADAKKDYDAGNAVIVDVRDEAAFNLEHIKGSLNIPLAQLDANLNKIPKGKKIIAYCS